MKAIKNKAGKICKFQLSESEYMEHREEYGGLCVKCGYDQWGVEPDAEKYKCEECGSRAVYGTENLLMMGRVDIVDDDGGTDDDFTI
jgi:DNA-directed RNA polymerase subunit RPC12/RpoP